MTRPTLAVLCGLLVTLTACHHDAAHSESYQQGHDYAHDYYSVPHNRDGFNDDTTNGYSAAILCQLYKATASPAAGPDWATGCTDAMHELGLKP